MLCGLGASEAWTTAFVTEADQLAAGFPPPSIEVANPLVDAERFLRSSMAPGLVRALVYNAERRQGDLRLFEVGSVFRTAEIPDPEGPPADVDERLCAVFAGEGTTPGPPSPPGTPWPRRWPWTAGCWSRATTAGAVPAG